MVTTYLGVNTYIANKAIRERTKNLNPLNVVNLKNPSLSQLADEVVSSPLLATRKIIIVHSLKELEKSIDRLIGVLENKKSTSHIIFVLEKYGDERLSAYLRKFQVIKINKFSPALAIAYAEKEAKKLKLEFTKDDLGYFLFIVGTKPEAIDIELKEFIKHGIKKVTQRDVRTHTVRRSETIIFSLTEAVFRQPYGKVVDMIEQYIDENPPTNLLAFINMLISDLKLAILIKACKEKGLAINRISANPYRIRKINNSIKSFTLNKLIEFYCTANQAIYEKDRVGNSLLPLFYRGFYEFRRG